MPNGHSTLSLLSRPGLIPTRHSRPTQWTSLPLSAACPIHAAAEQKVGNLEDSTLGLIPGQPHTASGLRWGVRPQSPFRFPISTFTAHPVRLLAPPCGPGLDGLLSGTAGGRSNVSASCLACPIHAGAVFKIVTRFLEAGRCGHLGCDDLPATPYTDTRAALMRRDSLAARLSRNAPRKRIRARQPAGDPYTRLCSYRLPKTMYGMPHQTRDIPL